jgi:hypothetical protein
MACHSSPFTGHGLIGRDAQNLVTPCTPSATVPKSSRPIQRLLQSTTDRWDSSTLTYVHLMARFSRLKKFPFFLCEPYSYTSSRRRSKVERLGVVRVAITSPRPFQAASQPRNLTSPGIDPTLPMIDKRLHPGPIFFFRSRQNFSSCSFTTCKLGHAIYSDGTGGKKSDAPAGANGQAHEHSAGADRGPTSSPCPLGSPSPMAS